MRLIVAPISENQVFRCNFSAQKTSSTWDRKRFANLFITQCHLRNQCWRHTDQPMATQVPRDDDFMTSNLHHQPVTGDGPKPAASDASAMAPPMAVGTNTKQA